MTSLVSVNLRRWKQVVKRLRMFVGYLKMMMMLFRCCLQKLLYRCLLLQLSCLFNCVNILHIHWTRTYSLYCFRCTEKKRAMWNVGNISDLSENGVKGCVRAKFDLGSLPSAPYLAALSFTSEGTTFSGVDLELLGSGYRMSLVKKRIVSGKSDWCRISM